jgi:AraC family transcriptional regulator, ethanolamine operon transcriptional activator
MCEALGVKERTLYLTCVEAFGRPPKALLLELRLNGVRRVLVHPADDQTVTAAASSFGFWHLGEFSAEYRRQIWRTPVRHTFQGGQNRQLRYTEAALTRVSVLGS